EKIERMSRDAVIGKSVLDVFPGVKKFGLFDVFRRVWKTGKPENYPVTIYKDNRIIDWREYHIYKLFSGELVAVFNDVTERQQAVEALRASEKKFRKYISNAPDAIFIVDRQGRYIEVNKVACKMTGYAESELLNMSIPVIGPREPGSENSFEELKRVGRLSTEAKIKCKDGSHTWISLDAVTLSNDCFMAFCSDITENKRLQDLESRAQRLEIAGSIAGQVAHDFNNLLGPLMSYPELIRDELPENHIIMEYVERIEKSAVRMADISQQLLTLGRRGYYNQAPLNMNEVVLLVIEEMSSSETIIFKTDLDKNLMNIMGGQSQIHRVLLNLVHNACDAFQNDGTVTIKTENYYNDYDSLAYNRIPKGEYVKLTVSDNGSGIPDDIIENIFDPFFTTKTTGKKRGSGLGLSIVDAVVKDHKGYLDLISEVGQGTSFFLYFPITRDIAEKKYSDKIIGGDEKVLVVDDDEIQRDVMLKLLGKMGYTVEAAESGEKAIEFLKKNPQDIIVLDMVMPLGIDGTETFRQILEFNPDQKVIIVSGFSESERVLEAQKMGAGAFIKKPLTSRSITVALREELDE
ncbi:MAG: response regulator, partial [Calditrichia bacterium]|nr:response regulator [Calditrichia bacterium]